MIYGLLYELFYSVFILAFPTFSTNIDVMFIFHFPFILFSLTAPGERFGNLSSSSQGRSVPDYQNQGGSSSTIPTGAMKLSPHVFLLGMQSHKIMHMQHLCIVIYWINKIYLSICLYVFHSHLSVCILMILSLFRILFYLCFEFYSISVANSILSLLHPSLSMSAFVHSLLYIWL